uniref:MIT_C domain-containing protein n=1 Tax=Glossina brevipalpis TaxID=37001 RepID=A0A1A9WI31_9MUSC
MKKNWNVHQDLNYIVRAERCEKEGCILESQKLYEEGINKLKNSLKECVNPSNQEFYKTKLRQFEQKALFLNRHIEKASVKSQLLEQIFIPQDVRGHSFNKLFEKYLNGSIAEVHIYEPYMEIDQHFKNLICFIEVLVKACPNLQFIRLITKRDPRLTSQQLKIFQTLKSDLSSGDVSFNHQFNPAIREGKIMFNNGMIIKSTRGLHIYQTQSGPYRLGSFDYDFLHCLKSEIRIYRTIPFRYSFNEPEEEHEESRIRNEPSVHMFSHKLTKKSVPHSVGKAGYKGSWISKMVLEVILRKVFGDFYRLQKSNYNSATLTP